MELFSYSIDKCLKKNDIRLSLLLSSIFIKRKSRSSYSISPSLILSRDPTTIHICLSVYLLKNVQVKKTIITKIECPFSIMLILQVFTETQLHPYLPF